MHIFIKFYYSRIFILRLSSRFTQLKFIFLQGCTLVHPCLFVYQYLAFRLHQGTALHG